MRGKKHSPEVKAAVMAALLTGQGVAAVASQYKLDKSVVSRWRAQINSDELQQVATKKGMSLPSFSQMLSGQSSSRLRFRLTRSDRRRAGPGYDSIPPLNSPLLSGFSQIKGFAFWKRPSTVPTQEVLRLINWSPLPGPQTEAFNSPADIMFYGGAGGGSPWKRRLMADIPVRVSDIDVDLADRGKEDFEQGSFQQRCL